MEPTWHRPQKRFTVEGSRLSVKVLTTCPVHGENRNVSGQRDRKNQQTRIALIRAAEKLFAERGIDHVAISDIAEAADQKNRSAVNYHFGDKTNLLYAVLERHSEPIQNRWLVEIQTLSDNNKLTIEAVMSMLTSSIVGKLNDDDGGPYYLQICTQMLAHPKFPLFEAPVRVTPGAVRMAQEVHRLASVPPELLLLRMQRVMATLYQSVFDYTRSSQAQRLVSLETFTADVTAALVALVLAKSK